MNLLIIGGGPAGCALGAALAKRGPKNVDFKITLVDPKDYYEVKVAALRGFFNEKTRDMMLVDYASFLPKHGIKHVKAKVTSLSKSNEATLSNGDVLQFDLCLITVGAACPLSGVDPEALDIEGRKKELQETGLSYKDKSVLVIGGGTVGCELVGELSHERKEDETSEKNITIVQGAESFCPQMSAKGQRLVEKKMVKSGIVMYLNSKAEENGSGSWTVVSKSENHNSVNVSAEMVALCTGYKSRNEFINGGFSLNERGWIETDDYFRVKGGDGNVFAFGDCCTTGPQSVMDIMTNAHFAHNNIKKTAEALAKGDDLEHVKLTKAGSPPPITVLTYGPRDGVFDNPIFPTSWALPWVKNLDMFIGNAKGLLKQ